MNKTEKLRVDEKSPVQWAKGWQRTPISERRQMKVWKKPFAFYRDALVDQLRKVGATDVLITFNTGDNARLDPGVTVYFSKPRKEDFSWQLALGIENPAPTLQEIDEAYRRKAMDNHPDRGGDVEIFRALGQHRDRAKAWVKDTKGEHEFALPCDRFAEPRWNINALKLGIAALRRLEEYGLPGMLERSFKGFRVAIEAPKEGKDGNAETINA
jgi:hypothetical protein